MISLNFRDSRPIYEQVMDGFRKLIVSGALKTDDKLPSVRELASAHAINPNTIQRAYRELEAEGFIYSIAGKGSFVAQYEDISQKRKDELMSDFCETARELAFLGVGRNELIEKLDKSLLGTGQV